MTAVDVAVVLAQQGLPCFPCRDDKRPATPRGFKNATRNEDELRELWRRHPGPLVGMPTGEISGLDVLDIDPRHGGEHWFAEHKDGLLPTHVHRTRSGGCISFTSTNTACGVARESLPPASTCVRPAAT